MDTFLCASCGAELKSTATNCGGCSTPVLVLGEIRARLPEPQAILADWLAQWNFYRAQQQELAVIAQRGAATTNLASAKSRLEYLAEARRDQAEKMAALLAPVAALPAPAPADVYRALRGRLPMTQNLLSYYTNVHRDWAWGEQENEAALRLVGPELDANQNLVVLGSGAGRLAYDLLHQGRNKNTLLLELNPFLLELSRRVFRGETIELWEFPIAPRDQASVAKLQKLKAREALSADQLKRCEFVMGDIRYLPLPEGSVEQLLLPWLIDILPESPEDVLHRCNRVLKMGGRLVHYGSWAFNFSEEAWNHSPEEAKELFESAGFALTKKNAERLPYMQSPLSCHSRTEETFLFVAEKVADVDAPEQVERSLPDWINDTSLPIPKLPIFAPIEQSHEVPLDIVRYINGKRSIAAVAKDLLVKKYGFEENEGQATLANFLRAMLEQSRFRG